MIIFHCSSIIWLCRCLNLGRNYLVHATIIISSRHQSVCVMLIMTTSQALCLVVISLLTGACAVSPTSGAAPRIAGGQNATVDQFPWLVSIIMDRVHFCTGSLVAPDWVLTSAKCTYKYSSFILNLGSLYPDSHHVEETLSHEKYVHPDYDADAADGANDVGLIKLTRNINFTDTISSVAIEGSTSSVAGSKARVAGWGNSTAETQMLDNLAQTLQWIEITILDEQQCSEALGSKFDSMHLCTSGSNQLGVCGGDDGGGLVLWMGDRWTLNGIATSTNTSGCDSGKPSLYTRVSRHAEWITSVTGIVITASSSASSLLVARVLMLASALGVWGCARKLGM